MTSSSYTLAVMKLQIWCLQLALSALPSSSTTLIGGKGLMYICVKLYTSWCHWWNLHCRDHIKTWTWWVYEVWTELQRMKSVQTVAKLLALLSLRWAPPNTLRVSQAAVGGGFSPTPSPSWETPCCCVNPKDNTRSLPTHTLIPLWIWSPRTKQPLSSQHPPATRAANTSHSHTSTTA